MGSTVLLHISCNPDPRVHACIQTPGQALWACCHLHLQSCHVGEPDRPQESRACSCARGARTWSHLATCMRDLPQGRLWALAGLTPASMKLDLDACSRG